MRTKNLWARAGAVVMLGCAACGTANFTVEEISASQGATSGTSAGSTSDQAGGSTTTTGGSTTTASGASTGGGSATSSTSSGGTGGGTCTDTWGNFADSFFSRNCNGCHNYTTYSSVQSNAGSIVDEISSGAMPKDGSLSSDDHTRILAWFNCNMPQ